MLSKTSANWRGFRRALDWIKLMLLLSYLYHLPVGGYLVEAFSEEGMAKLSERNVLFLK